MYICIYIYIFFLAISAFFHRHAQREREVGIKGAARDAFACVYVCMSVYGILFNTEFLVSFLFAYAAFCHALFVAFECAYIFQLDAAAAKHRAATLRDRRWQPRESPAHVHPLFICSLALSLSADELCSPAKVKMKFLWRALVFDVTPTPPPALYIHPLIGFLF